MKRTIYLYSTKDGRCPVQEFFDNLPVKVFKKISWILKLITELDKIPSTYFKKLIGSDDIWECRIIFSSNIYRLFCFFNNGSVIVLTHGFIKKAQKTPPDEILKAEEYKKDYYEETTMINFDDYLENKLKNNPSLSKNFWEGYEKFKLGVILKEARIEAGLTQNDIAKKIHTTKSVISRIENHAEDIRLSTLDKFAKALNKSIRISIY